MNLPSLSPPSSPPLSPLVAMASRPALLLLVLLVSGMSAQPPAKKKPVKKEADKDAAVLRLQKQIDDIVTELTVLKELQALQTVCLKGVKINSKCFLLDPLPKRYHTASDDCNALGGVLGSPATEDDNRQLADYVRHKSGNDAKVWLGVNDMVKEGRWVDQSGESVAYKNWDAARPSGASQPDGGTSQNCAVLSGAPGGKWSDENCRDDRPSVCQFNIV